MASIYELTNDFLQVQEMMESGEYDMETLENTLDCIEYEIEEKAEGYACIMKNIQSDIEGLKAEIERLSQKKKTLESKVDYLKKNLEDGMKLTGKTKFKTAHFSFNIQKNPPSVKVWDMEKVPKEYMIPQPEKLDNKKIMLELKAGAEFDWAKLEQTESLRIR